MDANAVAEYLKQNPEFFEDYADVIAEIFVPHPHGGHAIPIAERQIVTLREKNHELEDQAPRADPRSARENDADRREAAPLDARAVRRARSRDDARRALSQPAARISACRRSRRGCGARCPEQSYLPELAATSPRDPRLRRRSSARRIAGTQAAFESREWFEAGDALQVVRVPAAAHGADVRRCSALGSDDPERFYAGHGHAVPDAPRPSSRASPRARFLPRR